MRIDANGNVGIGTASPLAGYRVDVSGSVNSSASFVSGGGTANQAQIGNKVLLFYNTSVSEGFIQSSDDTSTFNSMGFSKATLRFLTSNTEAMRITSNGDVGIGTSSPGAKLDVSTGNINLTQDYELQWKSGATTRAAIRGTSADTLNFYTRIGGTVTETMRIDASGNVGIGTTAPISGYKLTMEGNGAYAALRCVTSAGFSALSGFDGATQRWSVGQLGFGGNNGLGFYVGSGTEVGRFDANGNLLVGATSGSGAISVARGAGVSAFVEIAGNGNTIGSTSMIVGQDTSSNAYCWNRANAVLLFGTNNTERARIDATGNLLVGTTSTTMGQTGIIMQPAISGEVGNIDIGHANGTAEGNPYARFYYNATSIGSITQSGTTAVLYNTSSDVRLKHDIIDAPDASNLIDALQVRSFKWNADNSEQRYGFVAQELLEVAPEAVSQPADPDDMMGVDYSKLVPMLVKEIQSLRARVAQLEGN